MRERQRCLERLRQCREKTPIRTMLLVIITIVIVYYTLCGDSMTLVYKTYNGINTVQTLSSSSSLSKDFDITTKSSKDNNEDNNDTKVNDIYVNKRTSSNSEVNTKDKNSNANNAQDNGSNSSSDNNNNKEVDNSKEAHDNKGKGNHDKVEEKDINININKKENNIKSSTNNSIKDSIDNTINNTNDNTIDNTNQGEKLIILVGLPKSGTESMHTSFWTIHLKSAHWAINGNNKTLCNKYYPIDSITIGGKLSPQTTYSRIQGDNSLTCYVGVIIQRAISNRLPPLYLMTKEGYTVFAQMDVVDVPYNIYIWPQFEMLDEFFKYYPKAHYIYTRREFTNSHIASLNAYNGLLERFDKAGLFKKFKGQSDNNTMAENCKIFIEKTREMTLNAFKARPDIKFLDICIDCANTNVNDKINKFLGITNFNYEHKNTGRYDKFHTAAPTPARTISPK